MKRLGVDLGDRRVGIAVHEEEGVPAHTVVNAPGLIVGPAVTTILTGIGALVPQPFETVIVPV